MSKKTAQKAKPPKLPAGEAEQVRIRREIGHDFALKDDRFGRKRLSVGTEEARRVYEVSNDGYTTTGGIVRVRNVDPLVGITSLTRQQREAGQRFRDDFERASRDGLRPMPWEERIDGGRMNGGIPDRVLNAGRAHAGANAALAHWEVADVVRNICLEGQSVKALAERTGEGRDVVVKLLKVGLDLLAVHYGMMGRKGGKLDCLTAQPSPPCQHRPLFFEPFAAPAINPACEPVREG